MFFNQIVMNFIRSCASSIVTSLIFQQAAEFSKWLVSKTEWTMKMAIKIFLAFLSFQNWRSKIEPNFSNKVRKFKIKIIKTCQ